MRKSVVVRCTMDGCKAAIQFADDAPVGQVLVTLTRDWPEMLRYRMRVAWHILRGDCRWLDATNTVWASRIDLAAALQTIIYPDDSGRSPMEKSTAQASLERGMRR